jgi:dihydrolipoamide dehydrogenase
LDSSERYRAARDHLAEHGVRVGEVSLDLETMMARKDRVVEELTDNVRKLLEGHGVEIVHGVGRLAGPELVEVRKSDAEDLSALKARSIVLATGSVPVELPSVPVDGDRIVDSTGAQSFEAVPEHLVVVGGGYIGLELGSVWARLGSRVTVLEALPRIAGQLDGQVGRALERTLKKQGLELRGRTRVVAASVSGDGVELTLESDAEGGAEELRCDRVLVAVGRRPFTQDLGLDEVGVTTDPGTGQVLVDAGYRTRVPTVYAVGDLVAGPMLAHKASAEGIAAVESIAGLPGEVNYDAIPSVIYTSPEVASVGWTEEQAKARGVACRVGTYPFAGTGRARCMGETEGFVKILAHPKTDRILGAHIIGPRASDLIAECVLAMELGASAEDLGRTVHGHPTFAEALMEAARAAGRRGQG